MAIFRALGTALVGIDAVVIEVEVDSRPGLPAVLTVGLPDAAVRESEDRVRVTGLPRLCCGHYLPLPCGRCRRGLKPSSEKAPMSFPSGKTASARKPWSVRLIPM